MRCGWHHASCMWRMDSRLRHGVLWLTQWRIRSSSHGTSPTWPGLHQTRTWQSHRTCKWQLNQVYTKWYTFKYTKLMTLTFVPNVPNVCSRVWWLSKNINNSTKHIHCVIGCCPRPCTLWRKACTCPCCTSWPMTQLWWAHMSAVLHTTTRVSLHAPPSLLKVWWFSLLQTKCTLNLPNIHSNTLKVT